MANVGSLVVEMALSQAKFQADLGRTVSQIKSSSRVIEGALKGVVTSLAAGFSIGAFVNLIKGSIDAADHLNDLSKSTGVAVETLGGIGFAAQQAGSDIDAVAKGFGKLNIRIAEATSGNADAVKLFKTLGISMVELKTLSPDQVFARMADKFAGWEDGANKAAIGQKAFGKEYQAMIPLLDDGGEKLARNIEYFKKYGTVTEDLAQRADEFNDTLVKLKLLNSAFANTLAAELLPSLQKLADHMVESKENSGLFLRAAENVASVLRLTAAVAAIGAGAFDLLGRNIGASAAALVAFSKFDFASVMAINEAFKSDSRKSAEELHALIKAIYSGDFTTAEPKAKPRTKTKAPGLGSEDSDSAAKKILEGQLKAIENLLRSEQDVLRARQDFLADYYQKNEISLTQFFDTRVDTIKEGLQKELKAYDDEIAAIRARLSVAEKPAEREELQNKINDLLAKGAKAEQDASYATIKAVRDRQAAMKAFADQVTETGIALRELAGDRVGAAAARFDFQNRALLDKIQAARESGDAEERRRADALAINLTTQRRMTLEQVTFNAAQEDGGLILEQIGTAQSRIALQIRSGQLSEIDGLNKLSELNRSRVADLQHVIDAMQAVADKTGDPKMLAAIDALKLKMEELADAGDLLAEKFQHIFADSFSASLSDVISGTKSLAQAFRDMEKSIVKSISDIASRNIADAIFGKSGPASGAGGFLSSLFGGGSSGWKSWFTGGEAPIPMFAGGTDFAPGGLAVVGERGPEIVNLRRGSQVVPNHALGRGTVVNNVFYISQPASRATQDQIANKAFASIARASRVR